MIIYHLVSCQNLEFFGSSHTGQILPNHSKNPANYYFSAIDSLMRSVATSNQRSTTQSSPTLTLISKYLWSIWIRPSQKLKTLNLKPG